MKHAVSPVSWLFCDTNKEEANRRKACGQIEENYSQDAHIFPICTFYCLFIYFLCFIGFTICSDKLKDGFIFFPSKLRP
jgi:hypothetical protein